METPSVRVLVVGDSGVGKTALLRSICRLYSPGKDKPPTLWTTGCDVHVLLQSLGPAGREVFVEFLDVGGHRKYELSRGAFYHDVHGVMFVHDLSNVKSGEHLRHWSRELSTMQRLKGCVVPATGKDHDFPTLHELPKLVVGNKKDLLPRSGRPQSTGPMGSPEFRTVACIESSAKPLSMEPSGAFDTFLQQTVAFANRGDGGSSYSSFNSNSTGLRQTASRAVGADDGSGLDAGLSSVTAALPPLSTGSGSARSRWW
ncbi:Rab-like protein 3 [Phytophthora pseudosyringae]|uniref:Rab-like protein 3 n=1 Tax=Phytophthora pseudosyringae TaxID=221518 RepID=A0A8T1W006_9STRA|nr:Rab-like protein 3 [Phytophthora pseudosyringae]